MQRESGISIPACCLLGEMNIFTLWVLCWDTKTLPPTKTLSHLTCFIFSRKKLPTQNFTKAFLLIGVPKINATSLVFCISLTMRHIIFVIPWTSRVRRAAPSKRSGAEVLDVCTSTWGCLVWLVWLVGWLVGWLTSRWIPMVYRSLREDECFFGDWKVWGCKVSKCWCWDFKY